MAKRPISQYLLICLSCLLVLTSLVACSGEILLPSGEIVTRGDGSTQAPEIQGTQAVTMGELTIDGPGNIQTMPPMGGIIGFETQAATEDHSIGFDKVDPEEAFKDAAHVMYAEFLNTGESDCILIRMDDKVILIDTADTDDATKIKNKLKARGVEKIDYLIITHYDNDHIGSVEAILKDYPDVGEVYMPAYVRDSGLYRKMMSALKPYQDAGKVHRITEDVTLDLGYGKLWLNPTKLEGYIPEMTLDDDHTNDASGIVENNFSIITSVYFGEVSMLLTGDAEEARLVEFNDLLAHREDATYTLVKAPHHGDYKNPLRNVLNSAKPRYCVVCTLNGDWVDAQLVTAIRHCGAQGYYTYDGDVRFSSDGSATKYYIENQD